MIKFCCPKGYFIGFEDNECNWNALKAFAGEHASALVYATSEDFNNNVQTLFKGKLVNYETYIEAKAEDMVVFYVTLVKFTDMEIQGIIEDEESILK